MHDTSSGYDTGMASTPEYASDGTTLVEVIDGYEAQGYTAELSAVPGGKVLCRVCGTETPAGEIEVEAIRRTEGASDPGDMALVAALRCPSCGARGTATLRYGPEASQDDAEVLADLDDLRR